MLTLYDYLPSQHAYKVRLLLSHLGQAYRTELVSIFEGAGQKAEYLDVNPTGAVPAIRLEDGRVLAESNAILVFLAEGSRYYSDDRFARAKIHQWLSFEASYVQTTIGALRYWALTGKTRGRPAQLLESKRAGALKALRVLNERLRDQPFVTGAQYTIADMSVFAYGHLAEDAGISLHAFPSFVAWTERVRAQPRFLNTTYPYAIDPHSARELP
jgi:glutathione S-transferase